MSYLENLPGLCAHMISSQTIEGFRDFVNDQARKSTALGRSVSSVKIDHRVRKLTNWAKQHNEAEASLASAEMVLRAVTAASKDASHNIFLKDNGEEIAAAKLQKATESVEMRQKQVFRTDSKLESQYRGHFVSSAAQKVR